MLSCRASGHLLTCPLRQINRFTVRRPWIPSRKLGEQYCCPLFVVWYVVDSDFIIDCRRVSVFFMLVESLRIYFMICLIWHELGLLSVVGAMK